MKSEYTEAYRELFAKLPADVQKQAKKASHLFEENPFHPSLHFKCVNKEKARYRVKINEGYRAVGRKVGDTIIWYFIGTHRDYERVIRS